MYRDRERYGEVIEPVHKIMVTLPRSDLEALDREVRRRQTSPGRSTASRDSLIRSAVRGHLQRLAESRLLSR